MAALELVRKSPESAAKDKLMAQKGQGVTTIRKVIRLENPDDQGIMAMWFGPTGSGKTFALAQLAAGSEEHGIPPQKILVMSSDIGTTGHRTITSHLRKINKPELLENVRVVLVEDYQEVKAFIDDPYRDLGDFVPDILAWDGFSTFQLAQLRPYLMDLESDAKNVSELRAEGVAFDKMDPTFQAIMNATVRAVHDFSTIKKPDGKILNKVLLAAETTYQKPKDSTNPTMGTVTVDACKALISGQGGVIMKQAFDVILRCKTDVDSSGKRIYKYVTRGDGNLDAKSRGIEFDAVDIPADACYIWRRALDEVGARR